MGGGETSYAAEGIAIIGMAGRLPGANHLRQFWQNLCAGVESVVFFSDQKLAAAGISPALVTDPHFVKAAARLEDVEWFDAGFFGYSVKEATVMDPQQRLFLECAWEALEEAGYAPDTYAGAIGVYAGSGANSYLAAYTHRLGNLEGDVLSTFLANAADFLTTRVSYKLNLRGPSLTVQTACSTSLVAVHLACQSLLHGECDMALAGGVSIKVTDMPGYFYQPGGIASPDGHCRAFDARAQGTLFGDGVGIVVLKRIAEALADGDHIYGVIRGSAINNDGASKVGYTAPSVSGQARVIGEALSMAGVEPETIGHIEAHGTGTALGDPVEIAALSQAFRATTDKKEFCALSSVKTNIGHLDAAAGIASLIKTALMLHYRTLPPSLHFEQPNPEIDFASSPFFVNTKLQEWKGGQRPRRAGVSSFGMGGTNVHMILEEAPAAAPATAGADRPLHLLALSAKTDSALLALAGRYAQYFDAHPDAALADVCFTANVGRVHFPHRLALVAASAREAREKLAEVIAGRQPDGVMRAATIPNGQLKIGFLFTREGSQYPGMGRQLYDTQPVFRAALDRCASLLGPYLDRSLIPARYPKPGEATPLDETTWTQPALFAMEYALAGLWQSWGIQPAALTGDGLGEYVAACVAGAFSVEEGLRYFREHANLPVRFAAGSGTLLDHGVDLFVEIGPHSTLPVAKALRLPSLLQGNDEWQQILSSLGELYVRGGTVDWRGFDSVYLRHRVSLPTYPFERRRYWLETAQRRPVSNDETVAASAALPSRVRQELEQAAPAARMDRLRAYLEREVALVLGVEPSGFVDRHQGFFDMGMESLTALELKSRLEKGIGCALPSTFSMNYPTGEMLAGYVAGQVLGWEIAEPLATARATPSDVADAVSAEIEKLSEDELAALLDSELDQI
ncbi:MAG TPA: beta-ketoacyl synthase N-terminal-like domain-containing protein, partial [Hyphomicrobiaceae bacterium]|nr:beta-ketoacyl synthase N-terminal-like domain-containing protein [Hyphomicrobiaceae bacterium]